MVALLLGMLALAFGAEPGRFTRTAEVSELRTWVWVEGSRSEGWGGLEQTFRRCLLGYTDDPDTPPLEGPCFFDGRALVTGPVDRAWRRRVDDDREWLGLVVGKEPRLLGTLGEGRLVELAEARALWPDGDQWVHDVTYGRYVVNERGWVPLSIDRRPRERCDDDCAGAAPQVGLREAPGPVLSAMGWGALRAGDRRTALREVLLADPEAPRPARSAEVDCERRYDLDEVAITLHEVELAVLQEQRARRAGDELAQRLACAVSLSPEVKARGLRAVGNTRPLDEAVAWWSAARVFDARPSAMDPLQAAWSVRKPWQTHPIVDWSHLPLAVAVTDTDLPSEP